MLTLLIVLNIRMSMQTRESANLVAVQLQFSCSLFLQGFFRFSLRSSLVSPRARPFHYHPALLGPNHLSSLFSLLFSLFSRCCSFPRSHFANATSICVSSHRLRAKLSRPFAAPFWDRNIAFFVPLLLIVIVSFCSLLYALFPRVS